MAPDILHSKPGVTHGQGQTLSALCCVTVTEEAVTEGERTNTVLFYGWRGYTTTTTTRLAAFDCIALRRSQIFNTDKL